MNKKGIFIVLLIAMLGTIVLGCLCENKMEESVMTNKKYIDNYVQEIDDSFIYVKKESNGDDYSFYYKSDKYKNFVLVVEAKKEDGNYVITNNYKSLEKQKLLIEEIEKIVGEDKILSILNSEELNILETVEEGLEYNTFKMNIGLKNTEDIETEIANLKQKIVDANMNCSIYFYHLNEEQFEIYSKQGIEDVEQGFENYEMVIIENGKIVTEIKYKN